MSSLGINYYNKISRFFIRKGNKAIMEKLFRNVLLLQAIDNNKKVSMLQSLENCYYNSMYFIKLREKTKKGSKYVTYKVTYLEKDKYEKQGLISFGKNINKADKKGKPFVSILTEEIESLGNLNNKTHPVRLLRDNKHKLALKFAPSS
jgi:hypothetical protein